MCIVYLIIFYGFFIFIFLYLFFSVVSVWVHCYWNVAFTWYSSFYQRSGPVVTYVVRILGQNLGATILPSCVKYPNIIQSILKWIIHMSHICWRETGECLKTSILKCTTCQKHHFILSMLAYPFWPKINAVLFDLDPPVKWQNSVKVAPGIPKEICCRNIFHAYIPVDIIRQMVHSSNIETYENVSCIFSGITLLLTI